MAVAFGLKVSARENWKLLDITIGQMEAHHLLTGNEVQYQTI